MEKIIILDFGSQYTQLIARKIRELNVYSEIIPFHAPIEITHNVKGIILSGSPYSILDKDAPQPNLSSVQGKIPILGICYGAQLLAQHGGATITAKKTREYERENLQYVDTESPLFSNIKPNSQVWMSHGDVISELPSNFSIIASTHNVNTAAYHVQGENTYGIQFHPEVYHSIDGMQLLENFIVSICECLQNWTPQSFIDATITELQQKIGDDKVVLGLSGGVDSSVAAVLLHKAIGTALTCIFVDNGVLRKNEFESVLEQYKVLGLNVIGVNAKDQFLDKLQGVSDPETKRKIIGNTFIDVFDNEAHKLKNITWLAQGTIYPDVIESISVHGSSATIKSHHNVGGLPDFMKLKIVEPLRLLFKDEVRKIGAALEIPAHILSRHPFPGPGLAIRIIGEVTREKVRILQECDAIFIEGLKSHNLYDKVWQAGVVFLPVQSVGVMDDERTYENCVALRAVNSIDGMTADWVHLPYDFLAKISNEIINNVKGVNRVVYDISSKPPATIEWE